MSNRTALEIEAARFMRAIVDKHPTIARMSEESRAHLARRRVEILNDKQLGYFLANQRMAAALAPHMERARAKYPNEPEHRLYAVATRELRRVRPNIDAEVRSIATIAPVTTASTTTARHAVHPSKLPDYAVADRVIAAHFPDHASESFRHFAYSAVLRVRERRPDLGGTPQAEAVRDAEVAAEIRRQLRPRG
ncbi:hypothetical protein [Sandaracinus amylolyticus]|uniref:hypothetical protein n=1 Tax=Sandaracinus amylolyticus TaxID=927083 RepID=UPI001F273192|nr:hypothetical protein [Sandaracinus amylolyticus]UJR79856.1 Hypothetical protein I5071_18950 [Sandaracinus amylolyticus]